jgi:hypothetical protein
VPTRVDRVCRRTPDPTVSRIERYSLKSRLSMRHQVLRCEDLWADATLFIQCRRRRRSRRRIDPCTRRWGRPTRCTTRARPKFRRRYGRYTCVNQAGGMWQGRCRHHHRHHGRPRLSSSQWPRSHPHRERPCLTFLPLAPVPPPSFSRWKRSCTSCASGPCGVTPRPGSGRTAASELSVGLRCIKCKYGWTVANWNELVPCMAH